MGVYRKEYQLRASDVDRYRRLRLSALFTWLQEAAIAHTTLLGMGREKTLDRGYLWVVTMQEVRVNRLPEYDEKVTLTSWPGEMMHVFYPRFSRLTGGAGETLLTASSLWTLIDRESRRMVFPEETGVTIPGMEDPLPLPKAPKLLEAVETHTFTVPYSYTDLNGHMNNTRYLDLMEDVMPPDLRQKSVRAIAAEFSGEAPAGTVLRLALGRAGNACTLLGETEKRLFRLRLEYE